MSRDDEIVVGSRVEAGDPFGGTYATGTVEEISSDSDPGEVPRAVAWVRWDAPGHSWTPVSRLLPEGTLQQPSRP